MTMTPHITIIYVDFRIQYIPQNDLHIFPRQIFFLSYHMTVFSEV